MEALRAGRSLNPRPEEVSDPSFAASEFFDPRDLVQVKYEMLRQVRVDGQSVSRSAAAFGFSRPSFYLAAAAVNAAGLAGLVPSRPGPRRAHKLTDEVVAFARQARAGDPVPGWAGVGRLDRRPVQGAGASPFGGTSRGQGGAPQKRQAVMSVATRRSTWNGMNGCAVLPCPVTRAGGGPGWWCCSTAGSRPGCAPVGRCLLPRHRPPHSGARCCPAVLRTAWCTRWPGWRSARWPVGENR